MTDYLDDLDARLDGWRAERVSQGKWDATTAQSYAAAKEELRAKKWQQQSAQAATLAAERGVQSYDYNQRTGSFGDAGSLNFGPMHPEDQNAVTSATRSYLRGFLPVGSAVQGAGALAQAATFGLVPQDNPINRAGDWLQQKTDEIAPVRPDLEGSFLGDMLPSGLGSVGGMLATGGAARALGAGRSMQAAAVIPHAALPVSGQLYEEAGDAGASRARQLAAAALGVPVGAMDAWLPLEMLGGRAARSVALEALRRGGIESAQEGVQQVAQNAVSRLYDPQRPLSQGVAENAAAGGVIGTFLGGAGAGFDARARKTRYDKLVQERAKVQRDRQAQQQAEAQAKEQQRLQEEQHRQAVESHAQRLEGMPNNVLHRVLAEAGTHPDAPGWRAAGEAAQRILQARQEEAATLASQAPDMEAPEPGPTQDWQAVPAPSSVGGNTFGQGFDIVPPELREASDALGEIAAEAEPAIEQGVLPQALQQDAFVTQAAGEAEGDLVRERVRQIAPYSARTLDAMLRETDDPVTRQAIQIVQAQQAAVAQVHGTTGLPVSKPAAYEPQQPAPLNIQPRPLKTDRFDPSSQAKAKKTDKSRPVKTGFEVLPEAPQGADPNDVDVAALLWHAPLRPVPESKGFDIVIDHSLPDGFDPEIPDIPHPVPLSAEAEMEARAADEAAFAGFKARQAVRRQREAQRRAAIEARAAAAAAIGSMDERGAGARTARSLAELQSEMTAERERDLGSLPDASLKFIRAQDVEPPVRDAIDRILARRAGDAAVREAEARNIPAPKQAKSPKPREAPAAKAFSAPPDVPTGADPNDVDIAALLGLDRAPSVAPAPQPAGMPRPASRDGGVMRPPVQDAPLSAENGQPDIPNSGTTVPDSGIPNAPEIVNPLHDPLVNPVVTPVSRRDAAPSVVAAPRLRDDERYRRGPVARAVLSDADVQAVAETIKTIAGDGVAAEFHASLKDEDGGEVLGKQFGNVVQVSLAQDYASGMLTGLHETMHWFARSPNSNLSQEERDFLLGNARTTLESQGLGSDDTAVHEHLAEDFASWAMKPERENVSTLGKIFTKVWQFLQKLGNALRGKGFYSVADIYGQILSGQRAGSTGNATADTAPLYRKPVPVLSAEEEAELKSDRAKGVAWHKVALGTHGDLVRSLGKAGERAWSIIHRAKFDSERAEHEAKALLDSVLDSPEVKAHFPKLATARKFMLKHWGRLVEGQDIDAELAEAERDAAEFTGRARRDALREKKDWLEVRREIGMNPADLFDSRPLQAGDTFVVRFGTKTEPKFYRATVVSIAGDKITFTRESRKGGVVTEKHKLSSLKGIADTQIRTLKSGLQGRELAFAHMVEAWRLVDDGASFTPQYVKGAKPSWGYARFEKAAGQAAAGRIANHFPHRRSMELRRARTDASYRHLMEDAIERMVARAKRKDPKLDEDAFRKQVNEMFHGDVDPQVAARSEMGSFENERKMDLRPHLLDWSSEQALGYASRAGLITSLFENAATLGTKTDSYGRRELIQDPGTALQALDAEMMREYGESAGRYSSEFRRTMLLARGENESDKASASFWRSLALVNYATRLGGIAFNLGNATQTFGAGMIFGGKNIVKGWRLLSDPEERAKNAKAGVSGPLAALDSPFHEPGTPRNKYESFAQELTASPWSPFTHINTLFHKVEAANNMVSASAGKVHADDLLQSARSVPRPGRESLNALLGAAEKNPSVAKARLKKLFNLTDAQVDAAIERGSFDEETELQIRNESAKRVNFRSGAEFRTAWMGAAWFTPFRTFMGFTYNMGRLMVNDVLKEAAPAKYGGSGNYRPLVAVLVGAGLTGEIVKDFIDWLRGRERESDFRGLMGSTKPVDKIALRFVENAATVGLLSTVESLGGIVSGKQAGGVNIGTLRNVSEYARTIVRRPADLETWMDATWVAAKSQIGIAKDLSDLVAQAPGNEAGAERQARSLASLYVKTRKGKSKVQETIDPDATPDKLTNEYKPDAQRIYHALVEGDVTAAMDYKSDALVRMRKQGLDAEGATKRLQSIVRAQSPLARVGTSQDKLNEFLLWARRSGHDASRRVLLQRRVDARIKALFPSSH